MLKHLFVALLLTLFLAACSTEDDGPGQSAATATQPTGFQPASTPTLAPELVERAAEDPDVLEAVASITSTPVSPTSVAPTPDLSAEEHLVAGETALIQEDFAAAAEQISAGLEESQDLEEEARLEAALSLGVALLQDGQFEGAAENLNNYLAARAGSDDGLSADEATAYFHLGQVYAALGDVEAAIGAYRSYLAANPEMAAYVQPLLADLFLQTGDEQAAVVAIETALTAGAERLWEVSLRQRLAEMYMAQEAYQAAQLQYDAIYDLAVTEYTRGEMTYLAGQAAMLSGDMETAYARFLRGIEELPRSEHTYLGLVELVTAEVETDQFQRGLVDYYAGAYEPAVAAFAQYLESQGEAYDADAHLYRAWSYENLGDYDAALEELVRYSAYGGGTEDEQPFAAAASLEAANLMARAGRTDEALAAYEAFLASYADDAGAPEAAWQLALLHENLGESPVAQEGYLALAEAYPDHENAPRALLQAGWLSYQNADVKMAREIWEGLIRGYPGVPEADEAAVWLLRLTPADEAEPIARLVISNTNETGYYPLRARELIRGEAPFTSPAHLQFDFDEEEAFEEAEAWLGDWLPDIAVTRTLTSALTQDSRFVRGEKLWQIGLREEARQEFEGLRADYADNALVSYQLALYFRDQGVYRSSIAAAASVLALSGQTIFDAPSLVGRLLYPAYYADLILPLAEQYGYDPLLQFALVRQESLFESFAASYVGAQGLSQVMPATGADIAERLNWPDYETADLNRPHVGLAFGAYYIASQLDYFDGNAYVALSAYNAGPGNAAAWYDIAGDDVDLYLDTVDFAETRLYIKRIFQGYQYYRYLYGTDDVAP